MLFDDMPADGGMGGGAAAPAGDGADEGADDEKTAEGGASNM